MTYFWPAGIRVRGADAPCQHARRHRRRDEDHDRRSHQVGQFALHRFQRERGPALSRRRRRGNRLPEHHRGRNSLVGVLAAVRAGLGVAALMPANLEPAMACHDTHALPTLPDVELGLARHPRTEGDPLVDSVETALRRMI